VLGGEGTLQSQIAGKPPVTVRRGDVLCVPAGTIHAAKNVGSGNGAELANYKAHHGETENHGGCTDSSA
jgi:quercetin dioxygenase-like cupin family protein